MMLYRMDRDYDIQDAFGTPQSLGAFKVVLDATFHEFFGAPSAPFIGYRGYEKDSSQYVKIMPIKHRQARKGILYKYHFLMIYKFLRVTVNINCLGSIIVNSTHLLI